MTSYTITPVAWADMKMLEALLTGRCIVLGRPVTFTVDWPEGLREMVEAVVDEVKP